MWEGGETERNRERERDVGRIILDVGEYALHLLCGRGGVDSHQICSGVGFFSFSLCVRIH